MVQVPGFLKERTYSKTTTFKHISTLSMLALRAACMATVPMVLMSPATKEAGEKGKKTQETAAMASREL